MRCVILSVQITRKQEINRFLGCNGGLDVDLLQICGTFF